MTSPVDGSILKAVPALCRAAIDVSGCVLYTSDGAITASKRDELLSAVKAGSYVEVDLDVLAYEQERGKFNRNYVRFREEALRSIGRSGRNKPFLRDHAEFDVLARGGTILESRAEERGEGSYAIKMRVRLTAPWAVELALRGLLSSVSIGWYPTGPVKCSVCQAAVGEKCWHWPGSRVAETIDSDGNKRYVRDPKGTIVVEWIYTDAELTECSVVSVPAVPAAGIERIHAALSAAGFAERDAIAANSPPDNLPEHAGDNRKETEMNESTKPTIVVLSPAQHAHYVKLSPSDQAAFAARSNAERDADVAAALAADPVVYTANDGTEIRKSDGPAALMFARQADQMAKLVADREAELAAAAQREQLAGLRSRAKEILAGLHGADEVHVEILRAVESIADESMRELALQSLKAWAGGGRTSTPPGVNPEEPAPTSLQSQFDDGWRRLKLERKLTADADARLAYVKTNEGRALYNKLELLKKQLRDAE